MHLITSVPVSKKFSVGMDSSIIDFVSTKVGLSESEGLSMGDKLSLNGKRTTVIVSNAIKLTLVTLEEVAMWVLLEAICLSLVMSSPGSSS